MPDFVVLSGHIFSSLKSISEDLYVSIYSKTAQTDLPTNIRFLISNDRGRVFTSDFSGRLASDNRKSRENSYFSDSLKVKRVGKLQCNSHFNKFKPPNQVA